MSKVSNSALNEFSANPINKCSSIIKTQFLDTASRQMPSIGNRHKVFQQNNLEGSQILLFLKIFIIYSICKQNV